MNKQDKKHFIELIRDKLGSRSIDRINDGELSFKHAGVLIPLLVENGELKILFTKRTDVVEHHKGQISFPGGSVDEEDASIEETALREAHEEIGLQREDVEILGRTDDTLTLVSSFIIYPFVGLIPYPYDFIINTAEVERLIIAPLEAFGQGKSGTRGYGFEFEGGVYDTPTYPYDGEVIWGATARIIENFMDIIGRKLLLLEGKK
ncbi:MAG: CoA pyrophosphatase [Desulfobacteraceae bacterium]|nr:CoA pyrophosphatase [Desulfobacteraceae bacterium]